MIEHEDDYKVGINPLDKQGNRLGIMFFGSGTDEKYEALKEMFYNPESYNYIPFNDVYKKQEGFIQAINKAQEDYRYVWNKINSIIDESNTNELKVSLERIGFKKFFELDLERKRNETRNILA